ncbi:MAG: hypothetical protein AAF489_10325 [Bacteroidota bacterium]
MNEDDFSIFKRFPVLELAQETAKILNEAGIKTIIADNVPPVDITFSGSTLQHEIEVRVLPSDFPQAEAILQKRAEQLIDEVSEDYYLFNYTDDELYNILAKPYEWGEVNYILAQQILKKRGKEINQEMIDSFKKEQIDELAQPEKNQMGWVIAGYIFAFVGGLAGLIIGWALWKAKKSLPDGSKVYTYSEKDRNQGKYIFYIGIIVLPIILLIKTVPLFWD